MGFSSWNCKGCGHSLLSRFATNKVNQWMENVVVLLADGSRLVGDYDGYGRVNEMEIPWGSGPSCYHKVCHDVMGRPEHDGESPYAQDQGFFFDKEHDVPPPKTAEDLKAMFRAPDAPSPVKEAIVNQLSGAQAEGNNASSC